MTTGENTKSPNRHFSRASKAWWAKTFFSQACNSQLLDSFSVCSGGKEFLVDWHVLILKKNASPRIDIFDDAWSLFITEHKLFKELAEYGERISPDDFERLLKEHGFKDNTETKRNQEEVKHD